MPQSPRIDSQLYNGSLSSAGEHRQPSIMIPALGIKVPHLTFVSYIHQLHRLHLQRPRLQSTSALVDSSRSNKERHAVSKEANSIASLLNPRRLEMSQEEASKPKPCMATAQAVVETKKPTSISSSRRYQALFLDAFGTLISPIAPIHETYQRFAEAHGMTVSQSRIKDAFRKAFHQPMEGLRYVGDGRSFWKDLVREATGSASSSLFEDIYGYYCLPEAYALPHDAISALTRLKNNAIPVVVVSNFDTRLKTIVSALNARELLEGVVVSAEILAEKPDRAIFEAALSMVDQSPDCVVHVGDHEHNDIWGAQQVGMDAWLWGRDVHSFTEIADRILT